MLQFHPQADQTRCLFHMLSTMKFADGIGKLNQLLGTLQRLGMPESELLPMLEMYGGAATQIDVAYKEYENGSLVFIYPDRREACWDFVLFTRIPAYEEWCVQKANEARREGEAIVEKFFSWHSSAFLFEAWLKQVHNATDEQLRPLYGRNANFVSIGERHFYWNGDYTGIPYQRCYNGGIIYHHNANEWSVHT